MGFCLFEDVEMPGFFVAVNSSQVLEVNPQRETKSGHPCCLLKYSYMPKGLRPMVFGSRLDIQARLMEGAKIGVQKVEVETFIGTKNLHTTPLLLNKTSTVVLVRELLPEQFSRMGIKAAMVSEVLFEDGKTKLIAGRPGQFAIRANAEGNVPVLNVTA